MYVWYTDLVCDFLAQYLTRSGDNKGNETDSRTNFHRKFDHHKCFKYKSRHKNGEIIKLFQ